MNAVEPMATDTTTSKSHGGNMWPSLEVATRWFDLSSIALAIGACIVFVSTALIVWLGIVKEHHWDVLRDTARERIVELEARSAEAAAEIARAHARTDEAQASIADANARAAEATRIAEGERLARVKIEQRLAPRSLHVGQMASIAQRLRPFAPQKYRFVSYQEDQEVRGLVLMLIQTLHAAGWEGTPPTEMLGYALVLGVTIEYPPERESFAPAANALAEALNAEGIGASAASSPDIKDSDVIRIKVGKKPM